MEPNELDVTCPSCARNLVVKEGGPTAKNPGKKFVCCPAKSSECDGIAFMWFAPPVSQAQVKPRTQKRSYAQDAGAAVDPRGDPAAKRYSSGDVADAKLKAEVQELKTQVADLQEQIRLIIAKISPMPQM